MELNKFDVTMISAFGRGNWLATELAQEGLNVCLIDVSSQLGVWPTEDAEGPFGFFSSEKYTQNFRERMTFDDPFQSVDQGLTFWLKDGPLEMKSSLTQFRLEKLGFDQDVINALKTSSYSTQELQYEKNRMQKKSFHQVWPFALATQLASTTYQPNALAASTGSPLPMTQSFFIRSSTRSGYEKSLHWVQEKNVKVTDKTQILDIAFDSRNKISGLELKGEYSGLFKTEQLVWALNSEETYFLSQKIAKILFPHGAIESEWCWVRYRMMLADCPELQWLPLHSILINEVDWPWTHENLIIVQRTAVHEQVDAWIRIPSVQRFNKDYLSNFAKEITQILKTRMPDCDPKVQIFPQEYYYTYSDLGAPRIPVYSTNVEKKRRVNQFKNVYFDSEEVWANRSWDCIYDSQNQILEQVKNWRKLMLQKQQQGKELRP